LLETVISTGVELKVAMWVIGTVNAYVSGVVAYELGDAEARHRHGLTEAQMRAIVTPYLDKLVASGRFPNLQRFLKEGTGVATDDGFEFGLASVIEGLATRLRNEKRPKKAPKRRVALGQARRR
jgi:hypothetical protein